MNDTSRADAARKLLSDIEEWSSRTSTRETVIGHVLFLHPGFVGLMRRRLMLTEEKEAAVRKFLADNPDGWRGTLPNTHYGKERPIFRMRRIDGDRDADLMARPRVHRDPCQRCGARGDFDCGHNKARLGMVL